jgi:hypothetical protein
MHRIKLKTDEQLSTQQ